MSDLDLSILEKLGALTRLIRKEVSEIPKVGVDITEIIDYVEKRIFDEGYLPAFPCTVSVNEVAAHYTVFNEGHVLQKGDLIKIDFGISHEGYITDNAFTIEVESNEHEKLMAANKEALDAVMDNIKIGTTMSELGKLVHDVAKKHGFETIQNLSGHQIARYKLHAGLNVPSYENNDLRAVTENMEFAVEPFFTYGEPKVKNCGPSNILHLINDKPVRDPIAKKILAHIREKYPKLPFSKRWLLDTFEKRKVLYALRVLKAHNIVYEYEALATVDGSMVTQYEDAVVFVDGKKSIITRLR